MSPDIGSILLYYTPITRGLLDRNIKQERDGDTELDNGDDKGPLMRTFEEELAETTNELEKLRLEQSALLDEYNKNRLKYAVMLACTLGFLLCAVALLVLIIFYPVVLASETASLWLALFCLVVAFIFAVISNSFAKGLSKTEDELSINEEKQFFYDVKMRTNKEKAHKFLMAQNAQLNKYETTHIAHMKKIYRLGCAVIIAGILLIVASAVALFLTESEWYLSAIGVLAGLLIDGVGAIVIAMYSKAVESTSALHKDMNTMLYAYLANMIAAQVDDSTLRDNTLSQMAQELAKH